MFPFTIQAVKKMQKFWPCAIKEKITGHPPTRLKGFVTLASFQNVGLFKGARKQFPVALESVLTPSIMASRRHFELERD